MGRKNRRQIDPRNVLQMHLPTQDMMRKMMDAAERLRQAGARVILELDIPHALAVIACLQLATRQQDVMGVPVGTAQDVIDHLIVSLGSAEPYLGTALRLGNTRRYGEPSVPS
jgi:hypothetical protein